MEGTGRWKVLECGWKRVGSALEARIKREVSVIKMQSVNRDADRSASKKRRIGHRRCRKSGGAELTSPLTFLLSPPLGHLSPAEPMVVP